MEGQADLYRLLDILGNRNRRRIIDLLRNKPCFVTEISERLMISPKAVIDHLQMLEQAQILAFQRDDHRRKYYYLEQDISVQVQLLKQKQSLIPLVLSDEQQMRISLQKLNTLIARRDEIVTGLDETEREIDRQIEDVLVHGRRSGSSEAEVMVSVALAHGAQDLDQIKTMTELQENEIASAVSNLTEQGIVSNTGSKYALRGMYTQQ